MKTYVDSAKEETGQAPSCTGALLAIKRITAGAVKSQESEYHGCKQYTVQLQIQAPPAAKGMTVFDRIRVGTVEDPDARKAATWEVSEGGPARLRRLLTRSGTALAKDDEEWMADAVDRTVVAPITRRGEFTNVGLYYRETDKDCPVIGLADGAKGPKGPRAVRAAATEEDDEDLPEAFKKKAAVVDEDDDEDDDEPKPKAAKKKPAKPADDDEDDEDD